MDCRATEGQARFGELSQCRRHRSRRRCAPRSPHCYQRAAHTPPGGAAAPQRRAPINATISSCESAVYFAILAILVYIWFRFEWQFGLGAVTALVHDVLTTIGLFAVLDLEFNLSTVAAILTIAGYSINDTVVVYDRVRENLRKFKKLPLSDLLNNSINQTLSRTLMTSLTTLLALLSLYFLGGEVIRDFSFAMIWGVIIGTYSSICLAVPLLLHLNVRRGGGPQAEPSKEAAAPASP